MAERHNLLLDAFPEPIREQLTGQAHERAFRRNDTLVSPGDTPDQTVFPLDGVFSVLAVMADGSSVEAATIGREGLLGYPLVLGVKRWGVSVVCQIAGSALVLPSEVVETTIGNSPEALELSRQYVGATLCLIAQTAGCNRAHPLEERLARWLLTMEDRMGERDLELTQEFLAQMLGVHRPSVTVAAGILQQAGLITYRYGRVEILNRPGLEDAACECYRAVADQFAELYR
jgi:CRP-like cAMP-binding protein